MRRHDEFDGWTGWIAALGALVVGLTLTVPATAPAQSEEEREVDDETAKKVLKLLKSGKKAYKSEDYQEAYDKFEKAYEMWPRAPIQARLGKAAEQLGDKKKAVEHYNAYLEEKPEGEMADKIRSNLKALKKGMPATLTIESNPSGANVYAGSKGGEKLGQTPYQSEVEPGEQTFLLKADGYKSTARTWELKQGEQRTVNVKLTEADKPGPLADPHGGSDTGGGARGGTSLAPIGWTTSAVGIAGIGVGTAFTLLKQQKVKDANSASTRGEFEDLKQTANGHYRRSLIAYSVGGALTAVGASLLLTHYLSGGSGQGQASKRALRIDVSLTADGGWAGFRGRF